MIDFHIHTTFSDGAETYQTIIDQASAQGIEAIAITDHFDPYDEGQPNRSATAQDLRHHFDRIRSYAEGKRIRVLCGIETCTDFMGRLRLPDGVEEICELIITSPHYVEFEGEIRDGEYYNDAYWSAYKQKVLAMAAGRGDVLGHAEAYLPMKAMRVKSKGDFDSRLRECREIADHYFDRPYIEALGESLIRSGKAMELHGATSSPREWVVKLLGEMGVCFSIGSDTHLLSFLGRTKWAYEMVEKYHLRLLDKASAPGGKC